MIYVLGDSHAQFSFSEIDGVVIHHTGPVTLKRVGTPEDDLIPNMISTMNLTKNDTIIFCFGEIDVRCYVCPIVEHRKSITDDILLQDWVDRYISRIANLNLNNAKIIIMSVVPPTTKSLADSISWPVGGSDQDRALFTKKINILLQNACVKQQWGYLDVYSQYVDEHGMMPPEKSDGTVHIKDNTEVKRLLSNFIKNP